jgi:hypothetical protein
MNLPTAEERQLEATLATIKARYRDEIMPLQLRLVRLRAARLRDRRDRKPVDVSDA